VFTFLDMVFVIHDDEIYQSTDEAATFTKVHTLAGRISNLRNQTIAPIPVMVAGALKLIGFYFRDAPANIGVFVYDLATDAWTDADTGVTYASATPGMTLPVFFEGQVYARVGSTFVAYDPISTGTTTLTTSPVASSFGGDQMFVWNNEIWIGPLTGANTGSMWKLVGSQWVESTGDLGNAASTTKSALFIDPNTGNLIVIQDVATTRAWRITPALVMTDITASVVGTGLAAIGSFGSNARWWPLIERTPGGNYTVHIFASRGGDTTDPIERFEWIDDATQITELGVVGGSADMAFPYAIDGGGQYAFFANEMRTLQTAQVINATGVEITCEAYEQGGTTRSVRGHYDKSGVSPNSLTLDPMTIGNPAGAVGLSVSGINPGAQIDGVPVDRTPITFDWDQITDGFLTGDNYTYQLEILV